jgi:hypothetical protein
MKLSGLLLSQLIVQCRRILPVVYSGEIVDVDIGARDELSLHGPERVMALRCCRPSWRHCCSCLDSADSRLSAQVDAIL